MDVESIKAIIASKNRETIKFELKSFDKLFLKDQGEDIAFGIVAFANRFGGHMIFGVDNSGCYEGKFHGDIDKVKANFYSITRDKVSPSLDLQVYLIETDVWDLIVVEIPPKREMPIAYIDKRTSHEIQKRIYYLRTQYGKKLVTDAELYHLFQNYNETFSKRYRLAIEFNEECTVSSRSPFLSLENYVANPYLNEFEKEQRRALFSDLDTYRNLILELFPYLLLRNLATHYSTSWYINIEESVSGARSSGAIIDPTVISSSVRLSEIQQSGYRYIKDDFEIRSLTDPSLGMLLRHIIKLPNSSSVLVRNLNTQSEIIIVGEQAQIVFSFQPISYGKGSHPKNALQSGPSDASYFFDCELKLDCFIISDNVSFDESAKLRHYFHTIDSILKHQWDVADVLNNKTPVEFVRIERILGEILKKLNN